MNQIQKTEWITQLAKDRFAVLMRNHKPAPYKSANDEWREKWERRKSIIRSKMIDENI
jgi:hypothetical protein